MGRELRSSTTSASVAPAWSRCTWLHDVALRADRHSAGMSSGVCGALCSMTISLSPSCHAG